jgi:MscS family membrane protein
MQPIWERTFLHNSLEHWTLAVTIAFAGWVVGKVLYWISANGLRRMAARTHTRLDDILISTLRGPLVVLVTLFSLYLGYHQLEVPPRVELWTDRAFKVGLALTLTWLVARFLDAMIQEYLLPKALRRETVVMDEQLVPVVRSSVKVLIWVLGLVMALNNAGYDVGALLAGIGIGGLALAMAAKDSVANVFGGITVFADKPFRVGDRIRIQEHDGLVEEVGLRSTRIRTMAGPVVVVPNHKFTDGVVENVSDERARRIRHELGLVYETPPTMIEHALGILEAIVNEHQAVLEEERVVSFIAFKEYSLNLLFVYHIRKDADIFRTQTTIHLEVMRRFAAAGLEFAYPTQVEYSKG